MWLIGYPDKQVLEDRPDDAVIDIPVYQAQWPGCIAVKFNGVYADLAKFGEEPTEHDLRMSGGIDLRPYAMPKLSSDVLANAIKAECSRRIYANVSQEEQINMASALPDADAATTATIKAVRSWVDAMRAACKGLISSAEASYAEDDRWPAWSKKWDAVVASF
jgi:hypothetical protein